MQRIDYRVQSQDGTEIDAVLWAPTKERVAPDDGYQRGSDRDAYRDGLVQLVHGVAEHKERYVRFAEALATAGYHVCAHDLRGHGARAAADGRLGAMRPGERYALLDDIDAVRAEATRRIAGGSTGGGRAEGAGGVGPRSGGVPAARPAGEWSGGGNAAGSVEAGDTPADEGANPSGGIPFVLFGHSMGAALVRLWLCRRLAGDGGIAGSPGPGVTEVASGRDPSSGAGVRGSAGTAGDAEAAVAPDAATAPDGATTQAAADGLDAEVAQPAAVAPKAATAQAAADGPRGVVLSGPPSDVGAEVHIGRALAALVARVRGPDSPSRLLNGVAFGPYRRAVGDGRTPFDWLTRDFTEVDAYVADSCCGFRLTPGLFRELISAIHDAGARDCVGAMAQVPSLVVGGTDDPVTSRGRSIRKIEARLARRDSAEFRSVLYDGARHELLNETIREEVTADFLGWIRRVLPLR